MTVLVVGANGQLGERCCRRLVSAGHPVRGSVRRTDRGRGLEDAGVMLVEVDLTSAGDLTGALQDVVTVVVTANSMVPRRGDDPAAVDRGLHRLIDATAAFGVRRVVLVSIPSTHLDDKLPIARERRALEKHLLAADLEGVVLRFPPFMECWFALVGSSIPLRAEPYATIGRPSPFLRRFRKGTATLVEDRGIMLVPGSPRNRNAFISEEDAAGAVVEAVERPHLTSRVFEVGGPQVLSWVEVAESYSRVLHRKVRILPTPAPVYTALATALTPVSAVPARTMGLNRLLASTETVWVPGGELVDPADMTTMEQFLDRKAAMPPELPVVA